MPGPYDFAAAAYDSRDGGDTERNASATDLAFGWGDMGPPAHGGGGPNVGLEQGHYWSDRGFGTDLQAPAGIAGYAEGGAIPTEEDNPLMNSLGTRMQLDINAALKTVGDVFSYGRKLHGLEGPVGGEQQMAAPMPGTPFRETPTDRPMPRPDAFPYGPGQKPFGQRTSANEEGEGGEQQMAASMPIKPFSQSPNTPPPMMPPGSLPYGPNEKPFGKRVSEAEPDGDEGGAIDTGDGDGDEETA